MEAAQMVRCAHAVMRAMTDDLQQTKSVEPVFVLLHEYGCDFVRFDPSLFNSALGKAAVARTLCQRASDTQAAGAVIGIDGYAFIPDIEAIATANDRLVRAAAASGVNALVRSGLGCKSEAIAVALQTNEFHFLLQQLYARDSGDIVFGDLLTIDSREFVGLPVITTGLFSIFPLESGCGPRSQISRNQ